MKNLLDWKSSLEDQEKRAILEWAERDSMDFGHLIQVARLSLMLFDGFQHWHQESEAGRRNLEAAALLHDMGASVSDRKHHKHSRDLILKRGLPGFEEMDLWAVASMARYHRKAWPSLDHPLFAKLGPKHRKQVSALSALLRMADGLDRSHRAVVKRVSPFEEGGQAGIEAQNGAPAGPEHYAWDKKKDWFEEYFQRSLVIRWTDWTPA